jgi:hypothetical protein
MSNARNQALLLRANKEEQVRALNELGFTEVTYDTPLSEIAGYIRWCGGLWDIRLACVKTGSNPSIHYFNDEEWETMSNNAKAQYEPIGACIGHTSISLSLRLKPAVIMAIFNGD